ncbi:DUF2892 domain-containing protein [Tateyamaria sp. ANG-S1]|uniref:YgaP family membrane protein n=1 Tax=Tateyamaria sp. ANG-S1 TaxID=1577905 RepID=UPI000580631F|nr:DUF2892 domain-containing protein [Tateyamaria sp. ANG-S1]KIC51118.1 hypothetical protein RA29_04435 [Tateyamaria sp. ANG-S1]
MKSNIGHIDRLLRSSVGVLMLLSATEIIPGIWPGALVPQIMAILGGLLIATSVFRFCPIYWLLGACTARR